MKLFLKSLAMFCGVFAFLLIGRTASAAPPKPSAAPSSKPQPPTVKAASEPAPISGKVVETMNAGGYTYVCLEKKGVKTWVAVPEMNVIVGQETAFQPGAAMKNFTSKTLGKTFDSIIFSGGPAVPQAGPGKRGAKNVSGSKAAASPLGKDVKVERAAGPDAYTVAEIYEKRTTLNKKTVVVRGKAVKVSAGIMGKNWVHLQDGTGDPTKKTHNLVVTTDDLPSVGDVVTVKGTVFKNKDFGSGYKYDVIMEKASIQR